MFETNQQIPLTPAQQAIWFGHQLDESSSAYNIASYIEISGQISQTALSKAFAQAVAETDSLRVRVLEESDDEQSEAMQIITDVIVEEMTFQDLSQSGHGKDVAQQYMSKELSRRIDLTTGPLYSSTLIKVADQTHWWFFKSHHIALDGFALSMFLRRVTDIYNSVQQGKEIPASPFGSLASLMDSELSYGSSTRYQNDRQYWQEKAGAIEEVPGLSDLVALPSAKALLAKHAIPKETFLQLLRLSEDVGEHWIHVCIAAFAIFLGRRTGYRQVVVGTPFMNRLGHAGASVPATMANVLPLQFTLVPTDTVDAVIRQVVSELAEVKVHQRYRAEDVRRDCRLVGEQKRLTGPQINIDIFTDTLWFDGAPGHIRLLSAGPADDLSLLIQKGDEDGSWCLTGMANPELYTQSDLEQISTDFLSFLARLSLSSDQLIGHLDAFPDSRLDFFYQQQKSIHEVAEESQEPTLVDLFEQQVVLHKDKIAVTFNGDHVSYHELNIRANKLARRIQEKMSGDEPALIALLLPRSIETLVTILACLKAGAAYVPMDTEAPESRINTILSDTKAQLLITESRYLPNAPECPLLLLDDDTVKQSIAEAAISNLSVKPSANDLAYVIYTSGSTGKPKGVKVTHHNVVRLFTTTDSWFDYRSSDVWTFCHSYIFDASVWEMWGALMHGGRLLIVPTEITRIPEQLLELVVAEQVTVFGQIPSAFYRFLEAELDRPDLSRQLTLRYQCFGGEALDLSRLRPWFDCHPDGRIQLLNMYGITETTVNVTHQFITRQHVEAQSGSLIGKGYEDLQVMILDDALRPVPVGGYGEIYVGGAGLAAGYLQRPDLDATRFVANPYRSAGARMYRSGDVAALHENGVLEYIGRADQQVKVRGYRIELGEIEAHLRNHPCISDAVASVLTDQQEDLKLVAHVVPNADQTVPLDLSSLREHLRAFLPAYMVPAAIGVVDALPFKQNGKVDKKALPEITFTDTRHIEPARDDLDQRVLSHWQNQLGLDQLGIDDNFFDMGGDSIKAIRVCRELDIPVMILFDEPTPRACADYLKSQGSTLDSAATYLHCFDQTVREDGLNLICIPFAGGNAFAFRSLMDSLSGTVNGYSINLPGHDPTRVDELFMGIEQVAEHATKEIMDSISGPIVLYGHCAGNALAVLMAKKLEEAGASLMTLVIGGMLPDSHPQQVLDQVGDKTGQEIIQFLQGIGGFKDALDDETLTNIARITKHDSMETATFFAKEEGNPGKINAPIHVVVGDQDPLTQDYEQRYSDWLSHSDQVSLSVIRGGGHYFVTDNAEQLADVIRNKFDLPASERKKRGFRHLRPFYNPFDEESGHYLLLRNNKAQMSLWPTFLPIPDGWSAIYGPAERAACLKALEATSLPNNVRDQAGGVL